MFTMIYVMFFLYHYFHFACSFSAIAYLDKVYSFDC